MALTQQQILEYQIQDYSKNLQEICIFVRHLREVATNEGILWDELIETAMIAAESEMDPHPYFEVYVNRIFIGRDHY